MSDQLRHLVRRGIKALEDGDEREALDALSTAEQLADAGDPDLLHLQAMVAWALQQDPERARATLEKAAAVDGHHASVDLDLAELELHLGAEINDVEARIRDVLERDDVDPATRDSGLVSLAEIRLEDGDGDEALELIDGLQTEVKNEATTATLRAFAHDDVGDRAAALATLRDAVSRHPDEADLHHQLGLFVADTEGNEAARPHLLRVLELDAEEDDGELETEDVQGLREVFEDILEEMPDALMKLVADAPIRVELRPTPEQVGEGLDPRAAVVFVGTPAKDGALAKLESIALMGAVVLDEADDEEAVGDELTVGLVAELRRFFGIEIAQGMG